MRTRKVSRRSGKRSKSSIKKRKGSRKGPQSKRSFSGAPKERQAGTRRVPLKLLSIKKSPKKDKKYVATFSRNGRIKQTHFGAKGYSDYNQHHDKARRSRYISRHKGKENWNDPTTAGSLSYHLLWGPTTSFRSNVSKFKRRFKL